MNQEELDLIGHYDSNPEYYSPLGRDLKFPQLIKLCGAQDLLPGPILDLGCGDGRLALADVWQGVPLEGIDCSQVRVILTLKCQRYTKVWWGDIYSPPSDMRDDYAAIVAVEVLEHLADPQTIVEHYMSRLRPGGVFVGTVPLNLPYKAHFQVYQDVGEVRARLDPHFVQESGLHVLVGWRA